MKARRTPIEIFSLSFLDIIACAFGAVVMLILLAKGGDNTNQADAQLAEQLKQAIGQAQRQANSLEMELGQIQTAVQQSALVLASVSAEQRQVSQQLSEANQKIETLQQELKTAEKPVDQATFMPVERQKEKPKPPKKRTFLGGVPVDSQYVIFVIDRSGSMVIIKEKVMKTVEQVLKNHPRVKGFQVLSEDGAHYISKYSWQWIDDTPNNRRLALQAVRDEPLNVLKQMSQNWQRYSNLNPQSHPYRGIKTALTTDVYRSKAGNLAIYVFGDDAMEYDEKQRKLVNPELNGPNDALKEINKINRNGNKLVAKINAIAFKSIAKKRVGLTGQNYIQIEQEEIDKSALLYSRLMSEVARQNGGAFINAK